MKPVLKRWILAFLVEITILISTTVGNAIDALKGSFPAYFTFPLLDGVWQSLVWYALAIVIVLALVPIGYVLGSMFIRIFVKLAKPGKKIQFIGFARIQLSPIVQWKQILTRVFFGVLLSVNFWILLFQYNMFPFWIKPEYYDRMYSVNGSMLNFPMIPWYWLPNAITCFLLTICFMILDSGLVYVKKVPEHPDFSDTERVGNILWSIVKGYAGIVVVLNFVSLISTPLGMEGSLVLYPMLAACYVFFIVTTIDLFKPWGQKLSFNAVKASRNPEIIAMEYKTSPVADRKDLYG